MSKLYYSWRGVPLPGRPRDEIWYFAFGSNMNEAVFGGRWAMRTGDWRVGRIGGYRLRFNLEGRPKGKAAPANISADPGSEVWGVLYRLTRADLVHLDRTKGVPGRWYRHQWVDAVDAEGNRLPAVTYIAEGAAADGRPSLRYITLIREGARARGLPSDYIRFLEAVEHAE